MEPKVESGTGLTPKQKQLLDLVIGEPYFLKTFYLSGGTALSSWYLHHRESYDLDFFSEVTFDYERITRWLREKQSAIGYSSKFIDEDYGFLMVSLRYPDDTFLKIDFNHYSQSRITVGIRWQGLEIDSLYEIAINKLQTLATSPRTRDYVDLYFILQNNNWPVGALMTDAAKKFPEKIDPLKLAKNFAKVSEYTDLPKMLMPFNQKSMEKFFLNLAKSLKNQIFQK